uniref:Uncharacterized protein n=1 Tax=Manihot esculenta TaxID=3983 RepID=A0A2C9V7H1_MANES
MGQTISKSINRFEHKHNWDVTWCPVEEKLQGGCEAIGGEFVCFVHFSRKYGLEMMPKNCKCSPSGSDQKLCTCDIIC